MGENHVRLTHKSINSEAAFAKSLSPADEHTEMYAVKIIT